MRVGCVERIGKGYNPDGNEVHGPTKVVGEIDDSLVWLYHGPCKNKIFDLFFIPARAPLGEIIANPFLPMTLWGLPLLEMRR